MLGRTKDQIRSVHQVNDARAACEALKLDALVLVGGMCPPSITVDIRIKGDSVGLLRNMSKPCFGRLHYKW